jgi:hypothetical protein
MSCAFAGAQPHLPASDSKWEEAPSTPDGRAPSSEEKTFSDKLQEGAFDNICRGLKLEVASELDLSEYGQVLIKPSRSLQRYHDQKSLALIDSAKLEVSLGYTQKLFDIDESIPFSLRIEGRAVGLAQVVRPLGTNNSCDAIKSLIDISDFKTVVPVNTERLSQMAVGELWRLPLIFDLTPSLSIAGPLAGPVNLAISLSYKQGETASVTVFRLSKDTIRLHLRIDTAEFRDGSGAIRLALPIAEYLHFDGSGFFEKTSERLLIKEIRKFVDSSLGVSHYDQNGRKVLMEFLLNANDTQELERLAEFLRGNLDIMFLLNKISRAAANPLVREGSKVEYLEKLEKKYVDKLGGSPQFTGADDYSRSGWRWPLQIPILLGLEHSWGTETDNIVGVENGLGKNVELRISQSSVRTSGHFLNLPLLGQITKSESKKIVRAATYVDDKGFPDSPKLFYFQQKGFLRHSQKAARSMVGDANDIMRLVGTRGEGENPGLSLPTDQLLPLSPKHANPLYRSAVSALTVVLEKRALLDILWAPTSVVVKAYVNALEKSDRELMQKVLAQSTVASDGTIQYEKNDLQKVLGLSLNDRDKMMDRIGWLAQEATGLVKDLAQAKAGDWGERVVALRRLVSGEGRSGLSYENAMKVLVQLIQPADLFGSFTLFTNKKIKGESDASAQWFFNPQNNTSEIQGVVTNKERFEEPSVLSD